MPLANGSRITAHCRSVAALMLRNGLTASASLLKARRRVELRIGDRRRTDDRRGRAADGARPLPRRIALHRDVDGDVGLAAADVARSSGGGEQRGEIETLGIEAQRDLGLALACGVDHEMRAGAAAERRGLERRDVGAPVVRRDARAHVVDAAAALQRQLVDGKLAVEIHRAQRREAHRVIGEQVRSCRVRGGGFRRASTDGTGRFATLSAPAASLNSSLGRGPPVFAVNSPLTALGP